MAPDENRIQFLNMFPGRKTIQLFKDQKDCTEYPRFFHYDFDGDLPFEWVLKLESLNEKRMGVFMTCNITDGQGRKKENIIKVRAAVADMDGAPLDPVWDYEPSMVVETSPNKYHCYFLADDIPLEGFSQLQKSIAYRLNSDDKVHDLPRVFRIPGFYHGKQDFFLSNIIYQSDIKHTFRELQEKFPPKPVKQWSAAKYQKPIENNNDEFMGSYGASHGERNAHIAKRIGGCIKRGLPWHVIEHEAMKEAASCCPPLPERETLHILKSLRRYA